MIYYVKNFPYDGNIFDIVHNKTNHKREQFFDEFSFVNQYEPLSVENNKSVCTSVLFLFRLSGLSPFMGDHDGETMTNILKVEYDFDDECFDEISDLAKDFIEKLLLEDQE